MEIKYREKSRIFAISETIKIVFDELFSPKGFSDFLILISIKNYAKLYHGQF